MLGYTGAEGAEFGEGEIEGHDFYDCVLIFFINNSISMVTLLLILFDTLRSLRPLRCMIFFTAKSAKSTKIS